MVVAFSSPTLPCPDYAEVGSSQSVAHARIRAVTKPAGSEHAVFLSLFRSVGREIGPFGNPHSGLQARTIPRLPTDKVRFVGEPIAM